MKVENIADIYELSPMQQGILFHILYAPDSELYFVHLSCTLQDDLNVIAFEQAWQRVVERHTILRTSFHWQALEKPLQIVNRQVHVPIEKLDWRGISPALQKQQLEAFLSADRQQGFDLTKSPLMRLFLIQLTDDTYQFIWSKSHLILDGWSRALILKEVLDIYDALHRGEDIYLAPNRTYGDYIEWLQQQDLSQAEAFWRRTLGDVEASTSLGVDRNHVFAGEEIYTEQQVKLSAATTTALQTLAQQNRLTLNTVIQGAYALLLSRYSNQNDVIFGVTSAGRPASVVGAESMVGLFINTLPARVQVNPEELLLPWLQKLQVQRAEVNNYEYSPLMQVQAWSNVPRNLPLFESIVVFENYPMDASLKEWGGNLKVNNIQSLEKTNYPLTVMAVPGTELELKLLYDRRRFDAATITRMLGHFSTLLESIATNPSQQLKDLPWLTVDEKHQFLIDWNNTQAEYPAQCIHQLFEAQVDKTPDAVAIEFADQQLTYRELNQRANQLAHYLQELGVKPEVLVGVCVERSLEMLIGLLAILKAGGAYLPLDPAHPLERLTYILGDAQVSILLTQQKLPVTLPTTSAKTICLDTDTASIIQYDKHNLVNEVTPNNLAYLIYTSGSTGKPKGVQVPHRGVVNFLNSMLVSVGMTQQDILLPVTTITFDIAVLELFLPLIVGARIVVVSREVASDGVQLATSIAQYKTTFMQATPATWRMLLAARWQGNKQLKILCGGETLPVELAKELQQRCACLWNVYGPTETTIWSTIYQVNQIGERFTNIPIGRPIANTQIYILDQGLQPVPVGVIGELYIGGDGVTRGYLNRPELTAERFISNPFSDVPAARLYKTGDLARYCADGNIEFLGRSDYQVKIRGFRIELGEIEAIVSQHPEVNAAAVIAWENELGVQRLVGYIVPRQESSDLVAQLQQFLKRKLPEYMVPATFVMLEALPLTPNNKVDRKALPAPNKIQLEAELDFVPPETVAEQQLADIWTQVLGLEKVGVNQNFFELGGDSIRSIQVQSQAREQGINFSLPQLFQYQTIREIVKNVINNDADTELLPQSQPFSLISPEDLSKMPESVEDAYPLSQLQAGMFFHSELSQEQTQATYHNITTLHLKAPFYLEKLQIVVQCLAERHPILRTSFHLNTFSQPLQLVHRQVTIPLQVVDLRHLSADEQQQELAAWLEVEQSYKFDWEKAPLLRLQIHRRSEETFQFSFTEHHAILDGWSIALMLTELFTEYFALLNNEDSGIDSPRAMSFRDFIAKEQQALASGECQQYWQEKLDDHTVTLVPRWSATSTNKSAKQVCQQDVTISPELSDGLKQLAKSTGVPLKSVLLAAHLRVLNLLSGQSDIVTGLVTNGRLEQKDGDRILGLFLNTLPLRLQLNGGTWLDLIQEVFQVERELLEFRWYPLAQLQQNLGGQALFEVAFNFVNFHVYQGLQNQDNVELLEEKSFQETNFPLFADFSLNAFSSEVNLVLEYDAAEFSPAQIQAIGGYYVNALAAMVSEPSVRYELQSLLSAEETQQLLVEWNQTSSDIILDVCIHQLIENQVQQTPDAVAVVFNNQQLTYRELNYRANQLAHYLQELGVEPEVLVGICVERSLDMVVGLLAILKAGGAYLPLDPSYPQERLAYMLADAQVSILLTQEQLLSKLPPHTAKVICLDCDWEMISGLSSSNLQSQVTPQNLAYVIYTSGSTGQSKGVMIEHQSLVNAYLGWEQSYELRTKTSSHLQMASFAFDVFSGDLVRALCSGGKLVLCPKEVLLSPEQLYVLMLQEQVDCGEFVPAVLRHLIAYLVESQQRLDFMDLLICGSDSWYGGEYEQFRHLCGSQTRLINSFGLTEATIDSSYFESTTANLPKEQLVPIGRPFPNTQIYILDSNLQPVPIGVTGELYISGKGLARGYRHRPDLTAQKFILSPFNKSKLYKTGDLARYWPDGNIEFLRRSDRQVKIRGFRIELGEIEAVLSQHSGLRESVVTVREDISNDQRLVAYVIPQFGEISVSQLRNFLKAKLPAYMIPTAFVVLETIPLTPNGKIDRRALPAPDTAALQPEKNPAPASTAVQELLISIWEEILDITQIGIDDNFFELGGHSLLATLVISQIRKVFKVDLPLRNLFELPTIAELAQEIEKLKQAELKLTLPPIKPSSRLDKIPLSFPQQRLW
ncbi:amino acid adenylation domain-containing protein, partial [Nostoc sp. NIES-2111]